MQGDVGAGASERQPVAVVELDVQAAVGTGDGDDVATGAGRRVLGDESSAADAVAVLEVDVAELLVVAERTSGDREGVAGEPGVGERPLEVGDARRRLGVDEDVVQPIVAADSLEAPRTHEISITVKSTASPAVTMRSPPMRSAGTWRRCPSRSIQVP